MAAGPGPQGVGNPDIPRHDGGATDAPPVETTALNLLAIPNAMQPVRGENR